jgi:hypothetical protein
MFYDCDYMVIVAVTMSNMTDDSALIRAAEMQEQNQEQKQEEKQVSQKKQEQG